MEFRLSKKLQFGSTEVMCSTEENEGQTRRKQNDRKGEKGRKKRDKYSKCLVAGQSTFIYFFVSGKLQDTKLGFYNYCTGVLIQLSCYITLSHCDLPNALLLRQKDWKDLN